MKLPNNAFWVGTSWKMNKTLVEAQAFVATLRGQRMRDAAGPALIRFVIPPFTLVRDVKAMLADSDILVGGQNVHWADSGPWTGEISAPMLADCGADLVEIGHSERRAHFAETDETVGLKVAAAHRNKLLPLVCVGETAEEKAAGAAEAVLERQVRGALQHMDPASSDPVLLAYEPVWAIGEGGVPATPDYADAQHVTIKQLAIAVLGRPVPVLYGGSVNPGNCEELARQPHIDGLFIGRSAWNAAGFINIIAASSAARAQVARPG